LAFPIQAPLVTRRLEEFYKVLASPSFVEDGVTQDSIAPIPSLHITLGVMKLMGQSEIEAAARFLKESIADTINKLISERGVAVRLKNLDIMQGDPGMFTNVSRYIWNEHVFSHCFSNDSQSTGVIHPHPR
jgi:hypothetical protein